jgi:microcystin-dependent protein
MQDFSVIPSSDNIDDSLPLLLGNDETCISCSAGSSFPTSDLYIGMICFRTDQPTDSGGDYKLIATDPSADWVLMRDYSKTVVHLEDISIPVFGAAGGSHSSGLVPDPGATTGSKRFLCENSSWVEIDPGREANKFKPSAASPAAMSVVVAAGFFSSVKPDGTQARTEYSQQTVTITSAPTTTGQSRIDLIVIDPTTGVADKITGTAGTSPSAPAMTAGKLLIATVAVGNSVSSIDATAITDTRAVWQQDVPGTRWCIAGGTADALTMTYSPAFTALSDGLEISWRNPNSSNATTAPTATIGSFSALTITKNGGQALAIGDLPANAEMRGRINATTSHLELVGGGGSFSSFDTGDVKHTAKSSAPSGWVLMNDGTIGDASSSATTRANADCHALFVLLWNNISNTYCPVAGGRGSSAEADWSTHHQISIPKALGRALASAGAGSGLTSRALGQILGEETHTLTAAEQASMSVSGSASGTVSIGINLPVQETEGDGGGANSLQGSSDGAVTTMAVSGSSSVSLGISGTAAGSGAAHENMQPTLFLNFLMKL